MITFLIGLIVITSTLYVLYHIGRIIMRYVFKQLDPAFEDILLAVAMFIAAIAVTTLIVSLIYLVGEVCIRAFA